jgi:hypothetical protein
MESNNPTVNNTAPTFRIYSPSRDAMMGKRLDINNAIIDDGSFEWYGLVDQKAWGDLTLVDNPKIFVALKEREPDVEMLRTIM